VCVYVRVCTQTYVYVHVCMCVCEMCVRINIQLFVCCGGGILIVTGAVEAGNNEIC
jgi:hypothetical protein